MKKILFGLFISFISSAAFAAKTVSGTIVDQNGLPVIGAAVVVPSNTSIGTTTDMDGNFTLTGIPDGTTSLEASSLGYETTTFSTASCSPTCGTITMPEQLMVLEGEVETAVFSIREGDTCTKMIDGCAKTTIDSNGEVLTQFNPECVDPLVAKKGATYHRKSNKSPWICVINTCIGNYIPNADGSACICKGPRYQLQNDTCTDMDGQDCFETIEHATAGTYQWNGRKLVCKVTACDGDQFEPGDDICRDTTGKDCNPGKPNAKKGEYAIGTDGKRFCKITKCDPDYDTLDGGLTCTRVEGPCDPTQTDENAVGEGQLVKGVCHAKKCKSWYRPNASGKCEKFECKDTEVFNESANECQSANKKSCLPSTGHANATTDPNATTATFKTVGNRLVCEIKACKSGFVPNDAADACIQSSGECSGEQISKIANATAGELVGGVCKATACAAGYIPNKGKCVKTAGTPCPKSALPQNAKAGVRTLGDDGKEYCKVTECAEDFGISADGRSCEFKLTQEESTQRIAELDKNYQDMREKETSLANRTIGATAIGTVGIGGMQVASALSEQKADADAEEDMRAYLATFRCDWGAGKSARGGETGITVGGAGQITNLYSEYMKLAADLKSRKTALGMTPGIESEVILNSANTGLYDDVGTGRADGAFVSLSDALSDPTGAAAAAWNAQKTATADKLKAGATAAGIGAIGSLAANIAVNTGKNVPKERSREINQKYHDIMNRWAQEVNNTPVPSPKCPDVAPGTYPNCVCTNQNQFHNPNTNTCENCPDASQIVTNNTCTCPADKPLWDTQAQKCIATPTQCEPECMPFEGSNLVVLQDCSCSCINGFTFTADGMCECSGTVNESGMCVTVIQNTVIETVTNVIMGDKQTVELDASALFELGKSTLRTEAQTKITDLLRQLSTANYTKCNFDIKGYTDPVGAESTNKTLSVNRAKAVKAFMEQQTTYAVQINRITTEGMGEASCQCDTSKIPAGKENDADYKACKKTGDYLTGNTRFAPCRRIEITISNCSTPSAE